MTDEIFKVLKVVEVKGVERFCKGGGIPGDNLALLLGDQISCYELDKLKEEGYALYARVKGENK